MISIISLVISGLALLIVLGLFIDYLVSLHQERKRRELEHRATMTRYRCTAIRKDGKPCRYWSANQALMRQHYLNTGHATWLSPGEEK